MNWQLVYTKQAKKDAKKAKKSELKPSIVKLLDMLSENPFQNPPPFEALQGDLKGAYSRRINYTHRLVYQIIENKKTVKTLRMWAHY